MATESGNTVSVWLANARPLEFPRLDGDATCDTCVVGAGIAGLSVAYELARAGQSVLVVDQAALGDNMTGRTTAHFTNAFDDRYFDMERLHGADATRLVAQSHTAAIERAARIAHEEGIDCDLHRLDGWLFAPPEESDEILERELDACHRAGLTYVELMSRAPLAFDTGPALRFPEQVHLHPIKYLSGLASAIVRAGGRIYTHTHVDTIEGGREARIQTERGPVITARSVVVATNTPVNDLAAVLVKQVAYQTYVVAAPVPKGSVTRALYWDTADPYHYVCLEPRSSDSTESDLLIVGGEDHRTGQEDRPEQRWAELEAWMRERFPMAGPVGRRWSGEVMEPVDGVAFIGKNALDDDNVFIVTGDSGNGMTHGVIAGMLLADLVQGRANLWSTVYSPARRTLRSAGELVKEQAIVARQYADWLAPGDVRRVEDIPRGEGAIVRRGLAMLAVHVALDGTVHENLAACPHMGCIVHWNRAEKSWDCPCHGSRFDPTGRVIHGPAIVDLPRPSHESAGRRTVNPT
jgi:glycine/D-amino acid oxidase-like deaminating enzyme/nitrite reductase/ring-hydroxylating ferredoxin subunit